MKSNKICFIMRGYAGSGKSTEAEKISKSHNAVICSADDYWMKDGKYVFDVSKLSLAHKECFEKFKLAIKNGSNVIIDNTNLKFDDISKYIDYLLVNNNRNDTIYSFELVEVAYNSIEKAIEYRSNREDGKNIPSSRMKDMYKAYKHDIKAAILNNYKNKLKLGELDKVEMTLPYPEDNGLHKAIICDLDGTLSIFQYVNGMTIRNPFEADKSNLDFINRPVAMVLKALQDSGHEIIFLSGREDKFRSATEEFLNRVYSEYGVVPFSLLMRKTGDYRSDDIVKKEIFDNSLKDYYNITAIFDDRPKVVRMWRSLGLFVFDCNYRGVEF